MNSYRFIADLVLIIHLAYVLFIVLGLVAILLGVALRWRWVRNFWFRMIHFLMIAGVVVESLLRLDCPLTSWEDKLREKAGEGVQQGSFIALDSRVHVLGGAAGRDHHDLLSFWAGRADRSHSGPAALAEEVFRRSVARGRNCRGGPVKSAKLPDQLLQSL